MRICPACGSEDIEADRTNILAMLGMDRGYSCPECGYSGRLFLDIDGEKLEEAKEFLQERDAEDFKKKMMDHELGFNRGKLAFGVAFLVLGFPLITLMPFGLNLNFFIGVLSVIIGLVLVQGETKKLTS